MDRRVWLLAAVQFASATGAYAFTGLLARLAEDLGVSVATAGQLAAAYALTYALAGPLVVAMTARLERRRMLTLGMTLVAVLNLAAAFAPDFDSMLVLRVLAAISVTMVLPGVAAAQLVPAESRGRALAAVLSGLTFAFSLGIPLGTAIGSLFGWRATFVFSGILAGLAAAGVRLGLPPLPSTDRGGALSLRIAFRPEVASVLGCTALAFAGLFCISAYIGPIVTAATGIEGAGIGAVQAFVGLGSLAGLAIGGRVAAREAGPRIPVGLLVLLAVALAGYSVLLAAPPAGWHAVPLAALVFIGAISLFALAPIAQARLIGLAPEDRAVALSLNGAMTFAGQGAGAAYGGLVVAGAGLAFTGLAGMVAALAGAALALRAFRRRPD